MHHLGVKHRFVDLRLCRWNDLGNGSHFILNKIEEGRFVVFLFCFLVGFYLGEGGRKNVIYTNSRIFSKFQENLPSGSF